MARRMIVPAAQAVMEMAVEQREHVASVPPEQLVKRRLACVGFDVPTPIGMQILMSRNVQAQDDEPLVARRSRTADRSSRVVGTRENRRAIRDGSR